MVDAIMVAPGYNNVGGMQRILPSPSTDGLAYPRKLYATDSMVFFDGSIYCDLKHPEILRPDDAVAALSWYGLQNRATASARVTVRLPDENMQTFSNYNAIAVRWTYGEGISFNLNEWYENGVIRLRKVTPIS